MEFIVVIVIGVVIYLVVQRRRSTTTLDAPDPGIGTIRRTYFYTISFVALLMAGNGIALIIQFVLEGLFSSDVVSDSNVRLAIGGSLTIVGVPLWVLHWLVIQRHVRELPVEKRSLLRKFHIYLVMGIAVGISIAASANLLQWAFGSKSFSGYPWAALIIWPAVWSFYWRIERAEGQATPDTLAIRRLYLYLVSLATLVIAAVGAGRIIHIILLEGYEALVSLPVLIPAESGLWRESMRGAVAFFLVGSLVWGSHWLYYARGDFGSTLRQVYLYIFAVLGGAVTVLIALGLIINGFLAWLLGAPTEDASSHFRFMPGALASLGVGAGLWLYHGMVLRREAEFCQTQAAELRRTYAYILSALGLATMVVAIGTLAHMAVSVLVDGSRDLIAGNDLWREPLALIITLGLLGIPLWVYYWASVQRQVSLGTTEDRVALARRIFIFAALGIGALAVLGSLSALIFLFLRDVLGDGLSSETLRDARPAFDVILPAAIFLPYFWFVYRRDRQAEAEVTTAEEPRIIKTVTVLVSEEGAPFLRDLEAALGYEVRTLAWADPGAESLPHLPQEQYEELARRISDAPGESVLLIPDKAELRVLSYN